MPRKKKDSTIDPVQAPGLTAAIDAKGWRAKKAAIADGVTFLEWCEQLAQAGLKVDGFPFKLDDRPAMRFIYGLVPATIEDAFKKTVVIMKCAQVGFTVMEMLASIYMGLKFEPCKVGLYVPDMKLAAAKSSVRFMPVMRTIPVAYDRLFTTLPDGQRVEGEGNVMIREMGDSRFHFLWTSGKTTTESFPMDALCFDEVQEIPPSSVEKTTERLSASRIRFTMLGSTANWPDADIHWWYQRGTQHQFHTKCPTCGESAVLDEHFPQCIKYDDERKDYRYVCPHCAGWIDDSQVGEWIAKDPAAEITSVHFPQLLSPTITPRDIIKAYLEADDMKNFFNRKLGKPYTDPNQVPVTMAHLMACVEEGKAAGVKWKSSARGTFVGLDQMGGFLVAIVKERLPDGRQAVIHVEEVYSDDPFARCDELMEQYGVAICVVEVNPNYNDAKRFAGRHLGKVFLNDGFTEMKEGMLRWGDAPKLDTSERRTDESERDRYTVTIDQYKCMQVSLARITKKLCLYPDPKELIQEVKEKGQMIPVAVLKDRAFLHYTKTALIAEKDEEQRKFRRRVVKVGLDPHHAFSNMLCDIAWARAHGTSTFILPTAVEFPAIEVRKKVEASMPGLPAGVLAMIDIPSATEVCGKCHAFDPNTSHCRERNLMVRKSDPACPLFVAC